MAEITWLHLSDLHFKLGPEFDSFNREIVLETLWEDIQQHINEGLRPDFVVFTGDLAYHGQKEEYELAEKYFIDPLLHEITGLSKARLFVVPGNHDIDWGEIDTDVADQMLGILPSRDRINQFLGPDTDRGAAFRKFKGYADFVNTKFRGIQTFSDQDYFYTRALEIGGCKIAIMGLNSAWMSGCHRDKDGNALDQGRLLIGERQLKEALEIERDADIRLAIFHHPFSWLHETDQLSIGNTLRAKCDFVLHGHYHTPGASAVSSFGEQAVWIPAGAVYATRDYHNGYNFVKLDCKTGKGRIYFRKYNDRGPSGPEWTKDTDTTGEELDGIYEFTIHPPAAKKPLRARGYDFDVLRKMMRGAFNDTEWADFVQDLRQELDDFHISGRNRIDEARKVVDYFDRRGNTDNLLDRLVEIRPDKPWKEVIE